MRDRGISSPGTKSWITSGLALGGAAALIWGLQSPDPALPLVAAAKTLGAIILIIALRMTANYRYTQLLIGKMQRGEDVIGRWTVTPDTFARFCVIEHARKKRKNNWRMPQYDMPNGLEVIFTRQSVLVGNTWFRLAAKGTSYFFNARIDNDTVCSVEFSMRLKVVGAGTLSQTARYKGHLRVPIADDSAADAARVVAFFRRLV